MALPHKLEPGDFEPSGSTVRYRLTVFLEQGADLAILVRKVSRAGRVILNDHDLGSCGPLGLELLRCMHQPQIFRPVPTLWRPGENRIEVEVYANRNQLNGLSDLVVGPAEEVYRLDYAPRFAMLVDSIDALSWITLGLGLLALMVHRVFPAQRLYLWYGLTCLAGALSNLNILVTAPVISFAWFDWLMFSSRLVFTCLLGITYLAYFERDRPAFVRFLVGYALLAPLAVGLFDNDPARVTLLYVPLQAIALGLAVASLVWAARSRSSADWAMALAFLMMPVAGFLDLARISGQSAFTGVYVLVYASAVSLVLVGAGLVRMFAVALRSSRDAEKVLQRRLEDREAQLQTVHARVVAMEGVRVRADERDRVMRDMHDGLLSSLELTRVALGAGRASPEQGARRVAECVADLRLMLEASGTESKSLYEAILEFRRRFDDAILDTGIRVLWDLALDGMPAIPSSAVLQVMRIVQEALNNAIRHSGARELTVKASWAADTGTLAVRVSDDGCGIPDLGGGGRGLANMRRRARELGGALHIEQSGRGTTVRLEMPGVACVVAGSA